jgi:hypothetical protein
MVPGKLFFMVGFYIGDPCPGKIKEKRKMANRIPDPGSSNETSGPVSPPRIFLTTKKFFLTGKNFFLTGNLK